MAVATANSHPVVQWAMLGFSGRPAQIRRSLAGALLGACVLVPSGCVERLVMQNIHNLDPDVESLPDGDAVGSDATGIYQVESQILRCEGVCTYHAGRPDEPNDRPRPVPPATPGDPQTDSTLCVIGEVHESTLAVGQANGHLTVEVLENPLMLVFEGGIDESGEFDVVGQAYQNDGALLNRTRVAGTFDDDGFEGAAVAHLTGAIGADTIDCQITYDVTGEREN